MILTAKAMQRNIRAFYENSGACNITNFKIEWYYF